MNYIDYIKYLCCPCYCIYIYFYPTICFAEEITNICLYKNLISINEFNINHNESTWIHFNSYELDILHKTLMNNIYNSLKTLDYENKYYSHLEDISKEYFANQILSYLKVLIILFYSKLEYPFHIFPLKQKLKTKYLLKWYKPKLSSYNINIFLESFLKKDDGSKIDKNTLNNEEICFLKQKYFNLILEILNKNIDYMNILYKSLKSLNGKLIIEELIENNNI